MKLINVMGSNASGKSTRVTALVKYLEENTPPHKIEMIKGTCSDGVIRIIGIMFDNIFVLGRKAQKGKWMGLDTQDFTSIEDRLNLYKHISTVYPNTKFFIQEGFFNNKSKVYIMETLEQYGVESYEYYFFIHKTKQEYLERCDLRSGLTRDLSWVDTSSGWRDNSCLNRALSFYSTHEDLKRGCIVEDVSPSADVNYLIEKVLGVNPNYTLEEIEIWNAPKELEEW